jgi:hypothetical protein
MDRPKFKRGAGDAPRKRVRSAKPGRAPNQYSEHIGPYSKIYRLTQIDLRTKEGLVINRLRRDLERHVGGDPSVVQRALIERCLWLRLRLSLLDKKVAAGAAFTEIDNASYIAWSNCLIRTLSRLGLEPKRPSPRRPLAEIHAELEAAAE